MPVKKYYVFLFLTYHDDYDFVILFGPEITFLSTSQIRLGLICD